MIPARRSTCQRLTEGCRSVREFTTTAHHRSYPLKTTPSRTTTTSNTASVRHYRPSRPRHQAEASSISNGPLGKIAQGLQQTIKATTVGGNFLLRQMTKPSVLPFSGQAATWEDAVSEAQGLVLSDKEQRLMDPIKLLGPDLWELKGNITKLLGGGHPFLSTMMTHFFSEDGRHIRPLAVLLMALSTSKQGIVPTQRRVAEITQMIHTATLLHDDVLDGDAYASNKLAILAGDFLLARASLALAHLRNSECVEVMATCIANIVEGEFMHLSTNGPVDFDVLMQEYMKKTYMRTASLMALSCKASVVLGGLCTSSDEAQAAYEFGKHFGIAHQLMDDVLRATSPDTVLDLRSAPFLFAWQSMPDLRPLVEQGCTRPGDAEKARTLLYRSDGIKQALDLATTHSQRSIDAIANLAPSDARAALVQLAKTVTSRTS